ncbi:uncharacterized protein EV422DRAFT_611916 [Fimicolochytrium jonesii]|uniref:uncharacterized protein n=1 Tax=Fimicolochytrium jonesii TaxID=1396493 RepID=UPI0022FDC145|nr:uncharacterized protein EV422DRAFT_611916 [Fimicolochytrium jonesii]KAI8823613.1 hypothetical protein EV422DRAFT_611916 [Fimicolochytrium jonesii]
MVKPNSNKAGNGRFSPDAEDSHQLPAPKKRRYHQSDPALDSENENHDLRSPATKKPPSFIVPPSPTLRNEPPSKTKNEQVAFQPNSAGAAEPAKSADPTETPTKANDKNDIWTRPRFRTLVDTQERRRRPDPDGTDLEYPPSPDLRGFDEYKKRWDKCAGQDGDDEDSSTWPTTTLSTTLDTDDLDTWTATLSTLSLSAPVDTTSRDDPRFFPDTFLIAPVGTHGRVDKARERSLSPRERKRGAGEWRAAWRYED